jgi:WD40 repeat protein
MGKVALSSPEEHLESMRHGGITLANAAQHFLPEGATLVLVIEGERRRFLDVLSDLAGEPNAPVKVVATVRADFVDRPLRYAEFGDLVAENVVMVAAPSRQELSEIVRCPAESVGVGLKSGLIDALVEDAHEEIGGLPLLQLALTELFEARRSDVLTLDGYRSSGGLAATVGSRAESVFRSLGKTDQPVAREVFLSLVSVADDTGDTRRRVRISELDSLASQESVERVLAAFGKARLLVFDRDPVTRGPTVEVAHEALIARWDRYLAWIDEVRDDLLARRRVELATREWLESGEDADYLLTGSRLDGAEAWRGLSGMRAGTDEARFLDESRAASDAEQVRVARARRRVVGGLSIALAVVALLGIVAWGQRGIANQTTIEARVQELAAQAHLAMAEDPNLAINLALQAYEQAQALSGEIPGEVMTALQSTLQSSSQEAILPDAGAIDPGFYPAAWSPDSSTIAVASSTNESQVVIYETDGFTETARFDAGGPVYQVNFAPDGESIAVSFHQGGNAESMASQDSIPLVARFEVGTWMKTDEFVGPCCSEWFGFSPDGRFVAAAGWWHEDSDFTTVWDVETPGQPRYIYEGAWFASWAPDSSAFVAVQVEPDVIHVVDSTDGEGLEELSVSSYPSYPNVNPATGDLVVVLANQAVTQVLSSTGEPIEEYADSAVIGARFSNEGELLIRWGNRDDVLLTDLETGETRQLHGHGGGAMAATESPDGRFLAVTTRTLETVIWDLSEPGPIELGNIFIGGHVVESAVSSDDGTTWQATQLFPETGRGVRLSLDGSFPDQASGDFQYGYQMNPATSPAGLVGGRGVDGTGRVESLVTGEVLLTLPEGQCSYPIAIGDPGELVMIGGGGDNCGFDIPGGGVVDLATGEHLFEIPLPVYAAFGHPGTATEDLVVINQDFTTMEVRQLPDGDLVGSMQVPGFAFRPFISDDGRWVTWGSQTGGAFLVDLEAVAAGTPMEDAVALNPQIESGPTHFTRAAGNHLAASYSRGVIRVWKIDTGELWFTLPDSDHPSFTFIVFSPDGRYVYYADGGVLRRMPLVPDELAALARERSLRDFSFEECERFLSESVECTQYGQ